MVPLLCPIHSWDLTWLYPLRRSIFSISLSTFVHSSLIFIIIKAILIFMRKKKLRNIDIENSSLDFFVGQQKNKNLMKFWKKVFVDSHFIVRPIVNCAKVGWLAGWLDLDGRTVDFQRRWFSRSVSNSKPLGVVGPREASETSWTKSFF